MVEKKVKEAFSKIKDEMQDLRNEITNMRQELQNISRSVSEILYQFQQENNENDPTLSAEVPNENKGFTESFKKENLGTQAHRKTRILKNLNDLELKEAVSIGNEGASALRHSGTQALRHQSGSTKSLSGFPMTKEELQKTAILPEKRSEKPVATPAERVQLQENMERIKQAFQDIFKELTRQEFTIFALLYQLEDELKRPVSYKELADRSVLTPNSIRDYISKLIAKKVPIVKEKYNNRQILLKIAPELRNIETLENLMKLVENE